MIPLNQISSIEITKGPFSSLYGPGAIGGVINVLLIKILMLLQVIQLIHLMAQKELNNQVSIHIIKMKIVI